MKNFSHCLAHDMFKHFSQTEVAKKTFLFDSCRCFCSGVLELLFNNIALLIAIRVFHASKLEKSILTSAWFVGNFIAPMSQIMATKTTRFTTMDFSRTYMFSISLLVFALAFVNSFSVFLPVLIAAIILFKQPAPLMADVYGQNYSPKERGSRLSLVLMIFPIPIVLFSRACGRLLDMDLQNYRLIVAVAALAAIGSGIAFSKIPSRVLPQHETKSVFSNFGIIFKDKVFALMLLWWTFAGIANQMTKPLRAEYLVNPEYGLNTSNAVEALACMAIPCGFRLFSSMLWGKFFDRSKVIVTKVAINIFLTIGIWLFFYTKTRGVIYFAAALIGIAYGGGEVALCLWVTRLAPKAKFSAYMSMNVAVVGLVGLLSPFIGYKLVNYLTFRQIGLCAAILTTISSIGFLSLLKHPRFADEKNHE
ncbi:MAG: MFS transporter [Puniceicoccales bacterium]|nr:MFS transporter [Puniceicoccales bacterium]